MAHYCEKDDVSLNVSEHEFRLPQDILTLLQLVSNDVELLTAIKPGRDRAAET